MPSAQRQWFSTVLSAAVLGLVLPHMLGAWYILAAMVLLPLFVASASRLRLRTAPLVGVAGLALHVLPLTEVSLALPGWLVLAAGVWLAANAAYGLLSPLLKGMRSAAYWVSACVLTAACALTCGAAHYGAVAQGVARDVTEWIDALPAAERARTILSLYQYGLATLDKTLLDGLIDGVRQYGSAGVPPETQVQILYSFRTTLELLLPVLLPPLLMTWTVFTAFLAVLAGEETLRRSGMRGTLPVLSGWFMPTAVGRAMLLVLLTGLVKFIVTDATVRLAPDLCFQLGQWAFAIQGAALLCHLMTEQGMSKRRRAAMCGVGLVIAPLLLALAGIIDQFMDPRMLRPDVPHDRQDPTE